MTTIEVRPVVKSVGLIRFLKSVTYHDNFRFILLDHITVAQVVISRIHNEIKIRLYCELTRMSVKRLTNIFKTSAQS